MPLLSIKALMPRNLLLFVKFIAKDFMISHFVNRFSVSFQTLSQLSLNLSLFFAVWNTWAGINGKCTEC
jgi:hypothetical protein